MRILGCMLKEKEFFIIYAIGHNGCIGRRDSTRSRNWPLRIYHQDDGYRVDGSNMITKLEKRDAATHA